MGNIDWQPEQNSYKWISENQIVVNYSYPFYDDFDIYDIKKMSRSKLKFEYTIPPRNKKQFFMVPFDPGTYWGVASHGRYFIFKTSINRRNIWRICSSSGHPIVEYYGDFDHVLSVQPIPNCSSFVEYDQTVNSIRVLEILNSKGSNNTLHMPYGEYFVGYTSKHEMLTSKTPITSIYNSQNLCSYISFKLYNTSKSLKLIATKNIKLGERQQLIEFRISPNGKRALLWLHSENTNRFHNIGRTIHNTILSGNNFTKDLIYVLDLHTFNTKELALYSGSDFDSPDTVYRLGYEWSDDSEAITFLENNTMRIILAK